MLKRLKKYKPVAYFLNKYKIDYLAVSFLGFIVAVLESINIAVLLPILYLLMDGDIASSRQGFFLGGLNDFIQILPFSDKLMAAAVILIVALVVKGLVKLFNEYLIARLAGKVHYHTKRDLIDKFSKMSYRYFLEEKHGSLMYYVITATPPLAKVLFHVSYLFVELIRVVIIVLFISSVNVIYTLWVVVYAVCFMLIVGYISRKISYNIGKERLVASTTQNDLLSEFIAGIKHIKLSNKVNKWKSLFDQSSRQWMRLFVKDMVWLAIPRESVEVISVLMVAVGILLIRQFSNAEFTTFIPVLGVFGMAIVKVIPAIKKMGGSRMALLGNLSEVEAVYRVLNTDIDSVKDGDKEFEGFNNVIKFENVSFGYNEDKRILKDINLSFEKNKINAIVGASGSGKTTIINLFLKLYSPDSGKILIDDTDLNDIKRESWFKKVALVSQEPFIINGTVKENIAFRNDQYTDEDIIEAAKLANAHNFIVQLDQGYDTNVGERGMKLSGGQQQRLSIARTILRKPEIFILDEATSALDSLSEKAVQQAMNNISRICTLIVIAHRATTIRQSDNIFVLKDGYVAETGSHEELIGNTGFYRELYHE